MGSSVLNARFPPLLFLVLLLSLFRGGRTDDEECPGGNANLGLGYSAATGDNSYSAECYPSITGFPGGYPDHGYDDSVAVFVGGNFYGEQGAEVEGIVVVLGDLEVAASGPSNFVSVGSGTNVLPNNGGDCIIVGGDLKAYRQIQVFNLQSDMTCDVVYKGTATNPSNWNTNGDVRQDTNYDMSDYEFIKTVFAKKSQYWKDLDVNAVASEEYTTTTFTCTDTDEVQVFSVNKGDRTITAATSYKFSSECEDKTILINVLGSGTIQVNAVSFVDYDNSQSDFSTCLSQSILWNFPDASDVEIGNGQTSEFRGSVLVSGNLKFTTSGHSGRTIALGDLTHLSSGSEFHSFQFQPPTDLPCVCVDEYCYEEGRCNPRCEDNMCVTDECVPIEVDCAEIIKNNVTLPFTVVYESCDVDVTLILREDTNTIQIDSPYGCELNVGVCDSGIYLGCVAAGQETGIYFKHSTEGDQMDLTGSYLVNPCCAPQDPADNRTPPPPAACDYS